MSIEDHAGKPRRLCLLCTAAASLILAIAAGSPNLAQAPPPPSAPGLEVGETTIAARIAPPGGELLLFGFAHRTEHHITTLVRYEEILEDADGDGKVELDLGGPIPAASIWVGVDFRSGASAAASPPGRLPQQIDRPVLTISPTLRSIDLGMPMAELLLVRPAAPTTAPEARAAAAFGARAGDGGATDDDGESDGTLRVALAGMRPIRSGPPAPDQLENGDVLVVIDPMDLRSLVVRFAGPGGPGQ